MGQLAYEQGNLPVAEDWLRRSLRAKPEQAQVWFRLGHVVEDQSRWADAEVCFARAHEIAPDFTEALYNRSRMLRQLGQPAQAARCVAQALGPMPRTQTIEVQLLQLRALLDDEAGRLESALATLDQAIQLAPRRAALHHNRAVLLQRLARSVESLDAHDLALQLGLDVADAHYNRGNSLQSLGRSAEALAAYRSALERDPQHALALFDVARLRWRLGDADFTAELDAAAAAAPNSALAVGIKGRLLLRAQRPAEAVTAFTQALALAGNAAGYLDGLGQSLSGLGRHEEALSAHRRAVELSPQQSAVHAHQASCLLQLGQAKRAAQVAEAAVRLDPLDQHSWALLGLAWRALGHDGERWLNNCEQHVQVYDLPAPPGWADAASFNVALSHVLQEMHTDVEAPIDQTLRRGTQTMGNLFEQAHPLVLQLRATIAQAVDRYVAHLAALPLDDGHPLLARVTPHWRFSDSWSSRLRSEGFHTNHVHPHGWISSCYYVALPPAITDDDASAYPQAGWIRFGMPDIKVPRCDLVPRRAERPQVGRLVLFPSFMWHGTVPFSDTHPRLTVAFDVMPLG